MEEQAVIEQVESALDTAVEAVVPDVVETVNAVRNNPIVLAGVALVAISAGAVIGYKYAERRLKTRYEELMEHEIAQAREFYSARFEKTGDFATVDQAVEVLVPGEVKEAMTDYQGITHKPVEVVQTETGIVTRRTDESDAVVVEEEHNIFLNGRPIDTTFDYEAEVAKRTEERPYVITEAEFFENEGDFETINLTYYEGDDVLTDEADGVVEDTDAMVGDANLQRFGHGSQDRNTVYIRNNKRGHIYEIARSKGKYTVEVLGLDDEDARNIPTRRFRGGDE